MRYLKFESLLQKDKWISPAYVGIDDEGVLQYLSDIAPSKGIAIESVEGFALPGFMNAHSHAFQYAMAGLAEQHDANTNEDFWTWREAMYKCALSVDPDQVEAIAAMLYVQMLRHGYTHVAEFHYLHHDKNGKPYAHLAEMGERLVSAAKTAGINITLVPVFYQKGGFGLAPQERQRRFISPTIDSYFRLLDESSKTIRNYEGASFGWSIHSLRAVSLEDIISSFKERPKTIPFHMHIAEQKKEIEDCVAYCGVRPFKWLSENLPVDSTFNLVHATHLDDEELAKLAASQATVVLCPSTEGNLGDGIFPMRAFTKHGGHWTIGTDSHIGINPLEEFRMIDYRQRLLSNQRNTFSGNAAAYMIKESVTRGRMAMGMNPEIQFRIGGKFNAVVYSTTTPLMRTTNDANRLSTLVYASDEARLKGTIVMGKWQVKDGVHIAFELIAERFRKAIKTIANR